MQLHANEIYHIYNRGNNKQLIYFKPENYLYFLEKVKKYIAPCADILCYCLMPNHFHFLIYTNEKSVAISDAKTGLENMSNFSYGLKLLLSSYSKAINRQEQRVGSLFTQNTHARQVSSSDSLQDYALWCFYYIHSNPIRAGLVNKMQDWEFSSFTEYISIKKEALCNRALASHLLRVDENDWLLEDKIIIPDRIVQKINSR